MQGSVRLDNINLFSIITIMSFFILAPVTLLLEGVKFTPSAMQSLGIANSTEIIKKTLLAGVCFHAYQQVSLTWNSATDYPPLYVAEIPAGYIISTNVASWLSQSS